MTLTRSQTPLEDTVEVTPEPELIDPDEPPVIDPECQENPLVLIGGIIGEVVKCMLSVFGMRFR